MKKLAPCPVCDEPPHRFEITGVPKHVKRFGVRCGERGYDVEHLVEATGMTQALADEYWNKHCASVTEGYRDTFDEQLTTPRQ